jgi:hypothetical protein
MKDSQKIVALYQRSTGKLPDLSSIGESSLWFCQCTSHTSATWVYIPPRLESFLSIILIGNIRLCLVINCIYHSRWLPVTTRPSILQYQHGCSYYSRVYWWKLWFAHTPIYLNRWRIQEFLRRGQCSSQIILLSGQQWAITS